MVDISVRLLGRSAWADCAASIRSVDQTGLGEVSSTHDDDRADRPSATLPAGRLRGWDCVEFWVGNARTTAGFLMSAFGFRCTAYAGPETGVREKASYVLEQGDIRFVVSGALDADSPIAEHVRKHGDGVHDLAWLVDDATAVYEAAVARGARSVRAPWTEADEHGTLELAQIGTYGETVHTFVSRARYGGTVLEPGYGTDNLPPTPVGPEVGLTRIDHVVGNVEKGKLDDWVRFYAEVLGFGQLVHFDDNQIATEYSALDVDGRVGRLQDRHADQRAGRRQEEEPDPGVRRHLRRTRRAAHRAADRRHRGHGPGAARPRRAVHDRARDVLRRGPRAPGRASTCRGTSSSG